MYSLEIEADSLRIIFRRKNVNNALSLNSNVGYKL